MRWLTAVLTFKRFVFYGFPVYLMLAEYAIRFLISFAPGRVEEVSILAASNSIAAAGLGLIAPVLLPKPVSSSLSVSALAEIRAAGAQVINRRDQKLMFSAYIGLLVLPFFWGAALWLAHDTAGRHEIQIFGTPVPVPFLIGLGIYIAGMIYTEVKEMV
jgi:asparagine N-glycosylation enzyme membrane subunit Stt3